jgi:hypothetical protein
MAKLHWNSVVSTENAQYMCLDINKKNLTVELEYFKYMKTPFCCFQHGQLNSTNSKKMALDGWVYIEIRRTVWVLLQAGILANKCLCHKLTPFGYYESTNTPGLWCHESKPITFTLVVNNFGVKFVNKADVDHLISSIKQMYNLMEDWMGNLYCGIMRQWDYVNQSVNISMPGYTKKKLQEYKHVTAKRFQTCPNSPKPKKIGTEAQAPLPPDNSP